MIPLQTAASHPVSHIVFAHDGSTVAVAQAHYGVTLIERATGRTVAVCAMPRRATLTGLTFCGDGKYLAAASPKGLEVFETATGVPVAANFRDSFKYLSLAARDGVALGVGSDTAGPVWRPEAPDTTEFHFDPLWTKRNHVMALSPEGCFAIAFSGRKPSRRAALYDMDAGRVVAKIERAPLGDAVHVAGFCPIGRRFVINDGHTLDVYDTGGTAEGEDEQSADTPLVQRTDGTRPATASVDDASRASLASQSRLGASKSHAVLASNFSLKPEKASEAGDWYPPFALLADGRGLLVKRPRNRVQLWDAPTGTLSNEWSWRFEWVTCVAVSTDGTTAVAGGRFGRLLLWDLE